MEVVLRARSLRRLLLFVEDRERGKDVRHSAFDQGDRRPHPHLFGRQELCYQPVDRPHVLRGLDDLLHEIHRKVSRVVLVLVEHSTQG